MTAPGEIIRVQIDDTFETERPTMNMRFKGGRLQQQFEVTVWRYNYVPMVERMYGAWRDVPSVPEDAE